MRLAIFCGFVFLGNSIRNKRLDAFQSKLIFFLMVVFAMMDLIEYFTGIANF
jgi:hypothetical protein